MQLLGTAEVSSLLGISQRKLQLMDEYGIVKPRHVAWRGRGKRVYSDVDVVIAAIVNQIKQAGIFVGVEYERLTERRKRQRESVQKVRHAIERRKNSYVVVTFDRTIKTFESRTAAFEFVLESQAPVLVLSAWDVFGRILEFRKKSGQREAA